jgi:hypothetical protein
MLIDISAVKWELGYVFTEEGLARLEAWLKGKSREESYK